MQGLRVAGHDHEQLMASLDIVHTRTRCPSKQITWTNVFTVSYDYLGRGHAASDSVPVSTPFTIASSTSGCSRSSTYKGKTLAKRESRETGSTSPFLSVRFVAWNSPDSKLYFPYPPIPPFSSLLPSRFNAHISPDGPVRPLTCYLEASGRSPGRRATSRDLCCRT